mmetsp:Transcript_11109/g.26194  ORF Transcript_11109/g.26194 Transcript_11109/m.26194 type:complete len:1165 (+) Transcript_11109:154-3648(+)
MADSAKLITTNLQDTSYGNMIEGSRKVKAIALIDRICRSLDSKDGIALTRAEKSKRADGWAEDGEDILTNDGEEVLDPADFEEIEEYFKGFERNEVKLENRKEFEEIELFIKKEKDSGRKRRETARLLAASEEVRIAADVAELKVYRLKQQSLNGDQRLHQRIADAEKSYAKRKMVIAKASQLATSDCRKQFKRVRDFFQSLHDDRKKKLRRQYDRSLKIQSMLHRLRDTDPRVMALEQNSAERIFRKKEADMGELNMLQNLEEATYLEKIISLLDDVQETKEAAADAYFRLQIKNLKEQQANQKKFDKEVTDAKAQSMLDMAELIAKYVKEEIQDQEELEKTKELVERTERKKDFQGSQSKVLLSVSDLYDTILWSVATGSIGLSSTESDSFESWDDDEIEEDEDQERENIPNNSSSRQHEMNSTDTDFGEDRDRNKESNGSNNGVEKFWKDNDTSSIQSGSTANTTSVDSADSLSPVGHIFVKELRRKFRAAEKKLEKRHIAERKEERRKHRAEARKLKEKHQAMIDDILAKCVEERQKLRDAIARRMAMVEEKQTFSTQTLQEAIEADVNAMQGVWVEHKRLEEEQQNSFAKAQALISAQVFHEVRNALSSVVAMSEMTSSLQKDPTVSSKTLVSSVSEMLDQNKEVVNYSLNMLNNILDVSKIKAGSFETQKSFFDLQDLVRRATTMQLVKAQTRGVKMSFSPLPEPQIAYSDEDIVVRIITNFISNAVKFTTAGAVQPFVCPLESIDPTTNKMKRKSIPIKTKGKSILSGNEKDEGKACKYQEVRNDNVSHIDVRYMAVGVADTGPGLSRELLQIAKAGLFNSDASNSKMNSGAKNSGFGLHLAHQLAETLDSEVNLTDLDTFQDLYNVDMASVLNNADSSSPSGSSSEVGSINSDDVPGRGTVLYITIPVVSDDHKAEGILSSVSDTEESLDSPPEQYVFSPHPSPNSMDGCFRILVADDVSMLRKGLVRSVLDIFTDFCNCPISVSTACTAEDALRALETQDYDLFISDNQFAPPGRLGRLSSENEDKRLQVNNRGDKDNVRQSVMEFFAKEAFTIAPGDGSLSGIDALLQLAHMKDSKFSTPILVLHSGHQLKLPKQLGIIVVHKPLKRVDFVPLFERNAHNLIETGMCVEVKRGSEIVVLNQGGAQLFRRRTSDT